MSNTARNLSQKVNRSLNRSLDSVNGGSTISMASGLILILIALFTIFLLIHLVQYLRTPCPMTGKKDFLSYVSEMDPLGSPCLPPPPEVKYEDREKEDEQEVWNISNQIYTYPEAKEKCKAYGARLATKQDIIKAYNKGAQWTNYGWSQGKEAYYPIQPCEYVKLRRQGLNIGPPGVNGGKFNPHLRFGVNCFGVKPLGEVVNPKSSECPYPKVCQRNPDACKPLKSDHIAPFFPHKKWSVWDD